MNFFCIVGLPLHPSPLPPPVTFMLFEDSVDRLRGRDAHLKPRPFSVAVHAPTDLADGVPRVGSVKSVNLGNLQYPLDETPDVVAVLG